MLCFWELLCHGTVPLGCNHKGCTGTRQFYFVKLTELWCDLKLRNYSSLELLSCPNHKEKWLLDCPGNVSFPVLGPVLSWHWDMGNHCLLVSKSELWEEWLHHPTFLEYLYSRLYVMTHLWRSPFYAVSQCQAQAWCSVSLWVMHHHSWEGRGPSHCCLCTKKKVIFIELKTSESDLIFFFLVYFYSILLSYSGSKIRL